MEINFDLLDLQEGKKEYKPEVLLRPNPQRFVLFPIQYNDLWALYKSLESKFWTAEEVELSQDVLDYQELEGKSKSFVTEILAGYYLSETFHNPMISNRFQEKIQIAEARCFLGFQQMQGYIYAELFGLEMDHLTDQEFREDTVALITQLPSMSKKQAWIQTYITDSKYHFSIQVVASIVHLAIFNSGLDAFIFHLSRDNSEPLLPGLVHSIAKLKQDKVNFAEFYKVLQSHVVNKVDQATIHKIVGEAVAIERGLVKDYGDLVHGMVILGVNIDFELVKTHVMAKGDQVCTALSVKKLYGVKDPLPWIETAFVKERDRYGKQTVTKNVVTKKTAKKEDTAVKLAFDADF